MRNKKQNLAWVYSSHFEHDDGDVQKLDHTATNTLTGEIKDIDYTPYDEMPPEVFSAFVSLGFPPRRGGAPWHAVDVLAAISQQGAAT